MISAPEKTQMAIAKKIVVIAIPHPDEPGLFLHGLRRDNGCFALPGGHVNDGEDLQAAAQRELREETGIECPDLKHCAQKIYNSPNGELEVAMFMAGQRAEAPKAFNDPDREFLSFSYLKPDAITNPHVPADRNILLHYLSQPENIAKSRPVLTFPKLGTPTRQDQQVAIIDSPRAKAIHGKVVAQKLFPDKTSIVRYHTPNPKTGEVHTEERPYTDVKSRQRATTAKRVTGRLGRNVLGHVIPTPQGPVAAAAAGKYRSVSENRRNPEHEAKVKEYNEKTVPAYREQYQAWMDKAKALTQQGASDEDKAAHNAAFPKMPRPPKRPRTVSTKTKKLPIEQQIERGRDTETTVQHEAAHMTFEHIKQKYGPQAVTKVHDKLLSQFAPETISELRAFVLRRGYKAKSPYLREEFLTHARDILVDPAKRKQFLDKAGPNGPNIIKDLKRGWEKAHKIAQALTPQEIAKKEADLPSGDHKDQIKGGLADKKKPSDFPADKLKAGIKVELEHTDDPKIAIEIAMDHLSEDLEYYNKLKTMEKAELLEKGLSPEELHAQGYRFKILPPTKAGRGFSVRAYHGRKVIGHMAFSSSASNPSTHDAQFTPNKGYHGVYNAQIDENHRGRGLYQHMIRIAADHVRSLGAQGLVSQGYQRSADATRAWDKVATHVNPYTPNAQVRGKLGPRDADYYLTPDNIKKGEKGDWQKEGYSLKYSPGSAFGRHGMHSVTAHAPDGTEVGSMHAEDLKDGTFQAHMVDVHPEHQRKGLGSGMYNLIAKKTGLKAVPDLEAQTAEGAKLWQGMSKLHKADVPKEYQQRARNSTSLIIPVSVAGRTEIAPGIPLHASVKIFTDKEGRTPDHAEVQKRLQSWEEHLKKPIDISKLETSYGSFKTREGKEVHAIHIHNPPEHLKQIYENNKDVGTIYPGFKMHISLPDDLAEHLKANNIAPKDAGIHFHAPELKAGSTTLKRFA